MAERKPIISFRNFSFQYRAQKRPTLTDIDLESTRVNGCSLRAPPAAARVRWRGASTG